MAIKANEHNTLTIDYQSMQQCTGIIIDDDQDIVETMSTNLGMHGFNMIGSGVNGCNAEKLFKEKQPDFVILDLNMPDYDGDYAIKKIKEHNPQAKIFIITGCAECSFDEDKVEAVFKKPVDLKKFRDTICKSVCS